MSAALAITQDRAQPKLARVSLTDRCDLACVYCRPHRNDGYLEKRLARDEWETVFRGLKLSGVERIRITGGEPLLHKDLLPILRSLRTHEFKDVALTTNGTRLDHLAKDLLEAGLSRVTISLDTLDAAKFERLTRGGDLRAVLRGIDAAVNAGFSELKMNVVVLRGENDDELEALAQYAWARGITPRFIELMTIGEGAKLEDKVFPASEMRRLLSHLLAEGPARVDVDRGPAKYVSTKHDAKKRVGFITGTTDTFCGGCDRLRIASDGAIRPCLATNDGVLPTNALLRRDAQTFSRSVFAAWEKKPDASWKGCTEVTAKDVSMRAVGG